MIRVDARLRAFTIVEVFAVLVLISLLVTLLLPAVQSAREMARRSSCANNMMQVTLAVQGYHSAFQQLPTQLSGTDGSIVAGQDNDRRLSIFVALLPFLEHDGLFERIQQPLPRSSNETGPLGERYGMEYGMEMAEYPTEKPDSDPEPWVAGGPEPFDWRYIPWAGERAVLRCPSDPGMGGSAIGRTNYAACLGDGLVAGDTGPMKDVKGVFVFDPQLAAQTDAAMRGMFVPRVVMRFADVTDGLSNTIMLGEMATDLGDSDIRTQPAAGPGAAVLRDNPHWARKERLIDSERPRFWEYPSPGKKLQADAGARRAFRWADGMPLYTGVNTILPPNRESVLRADRDDCWGILPASSRHQGGAQIGFGDGAVRFVTDSIDAGDEHQPTVYVGSSNPPGSQSPFGLWGALGTRSSGELSANSFASSVGVE